jgi:hypothetical protein
MLKSRQIDKECQTVPLFIEERPKQNNPDTSNVGKKWTDEEECTLLDELNKNVNIETISQQHKRQIGGINSRRNEIAYKMHLKHISIEEIIDKTKLDNKTIQQIIDKRKNYNKPKITETTAIFSLKNEVSEMKTEINELKITIKELSELIKAVYEFENI